MGSDGGDDRLGSEGGRAGGVGARALAYGVGRPIELDSSGDSVGFPFFLTDAAERRRDEGSPVVFASTVDDCFYRVLVVEIEIEISPFLTINLSEQDPT